jgi:hypothetical protein
LTYASEEVAAKLNRNFAISEVPKKITRMFFCVLPPVGRYTRSKKPTDYKFRVLLNLKKEAAHTLYTLVITFQTAGLRIATDRN